MYQEEDYNRDEKNFIVDGVFGQFYYSVASSGNSKYIENHFQIEFTLLYFGPFKLILNTGGYFNFWM